MKGLRSTLLLLIVLVGLGGYIYFTGAKPTEDASTKVEKVFPNLDAAKIEEMTVKSESGDVTTLKKVDGAWTITAPINSPASDTEASSVANVLATMDIARVVEEAPADVKEYGLDSPQMDIEFKADGGKQQGRLLVGVKTATGGNLYIRKGDEKRVLLTGQYNEAGLNKGTFDLREKHIVKLDRSKIDAIELQVGSTSGELTKKGEDWMLTRPVAARADNSAVDGLFGQIDSTEMKSVVTASPTPDDLKKYGLDKPAATITLRAGTDRRSISVGNKADDSTAYVRESTRPDVFTVATTTTDDLKKPPSDYRRKELFDFRAFSATHVELTVNGKTLTLDRVKATDANSADTWHRTSPTVGDPDRSKVEQMLAGLADIRATEFLASTAQTGLQQPVLTVVAKFDDGKREEKVTFGRNGDKAFAARPDDPGASRIEADKLAEALKAFDEISK